MRKRSLNKFSFVVSLLFLSSIICFGQKGNQNVIVKVNSITLVDKSDTVKKFSASILNENVFVSDFYKSGNLLQNEIVLNVTSKLIIEYKGTNYLVEEFEEYIDNFKSISIVFIIKDHSYRCVDVEYTKNGEEYISKISTPHGDEVHYCNYCIVKGKK
jgi:hypothetical protein